MSFIESIGVACSDSVSHNRKFSCIVTRLLSGLDLQPPDGCLLRNLGNQRHVSSRTHSITVIIFTNPSARTGYDTRSIFKRSLTGLNSEFFFSKTSCLTKAEEPSLPYYLPMAGGRIIIFIPFPRVLVLCEMQSVSPRIWTRIAVSISYDDNHYSWLYTIVIKYPFLQNFRNQRHTIQSQVDPSPPFIWEPLWVSLNLGKK